MQNRLNLPEYQLKILQVKKGLTVFDIIRKKYVLLTPEEEVRQQFVHYLINEKNYPQGLMAVEVQLKVFNLVKRADILLYNKLGKAEVLVECKAAEININQKTFDQIARYNMKFKAKYLIVTNGLKHYCCKPDYTNNNYKFLKDIPDYQDLEN